MRIGEEKSYATSLFVRRRAKRLMCLHNQTFGDRIQSRISSLRNPMIGLGKIKNPFA